MLIGLLPPIINRIENSNILCPTTYFGTFCQNSNPTRSRPYPEAAHIEVISQTHQMRAHALNNPVLLTTTDLLCIFSLLALSIWMMFWLSCFKPMCCTNLKCCRLCTSIYESIQSKQRPPTIFCRDVLIYMVDFDTFTFELLETFSFFSNTVNIFGALYWSQYQMATWVKKYS